MKYFGINLAEIRMRSVNNNKKIIYKTIIKGIEKEPIN